MNIRTHAILTAALALAAPSCTWNEPNRTRDNLAYPPVESYSVKRMVDHKETVAKHTIRYVEFDDAGNYWDPPLMDQAESDLSRQSGIIHLVYVHGWKNSSVSGDVERFNYFLSRLAGALSARGSRRQVVGTMLCWHADRWALADRIPPNATLEAAKYADPANYKKDSGPLWRLYECHNNPLWEYGLYVPRNLGYPSRHAAAERVAGGEMMDAIYRLGKATTGRGNTTIMIGHSMGGYILDRAVLQSQLAHGQEFPADLVFLVNANSRAQTAYDSLHAFRRQPSPGKQPLVVSLTGTADRATGRIQPLGSFVEGVHFRGLIGEYRKNTALPGVNGTELAAKAPGHVPGLFSHKVKPLANEKSTNALHQMVEGSGPWLLSMNLFPERANVETIRTLLHATVPRTVRFMATTGNGNGCAYEIAPIPDAPFNPGREYWIFQVPPEICANHNDIWNPNIANLMAAFASYRKLAEPR